MKRKLQIFVSSTYQDLIKDRQSAVGAILKAGHIPAGMELFTSGDQSQMTTIKRWIDESDVYMLILGGRYGSVEPISGVSYTELEYNYALEQDKPLFAIVINDNALEERIKKYGSSVTENENPKELKLFREKVLSNISSFFDDDKDIKLCVHESLSDFSENRELKGWVSADEIKDMQPLLDEITKLQNENEVLSEKLVHLENKIISSPILMSSTEEFEEIITILKSIDVKIPSKLSKSNGHTNGHTMTLYDLYINNKEVFITGVTNQINSSDSMSFTYNNICPKLQIHGLIINEDVAGVRWRRSSLTKKGNDLLAYIEKKNILTSK